jgi:D-tyrosyl-tRNA(Tyr) deacylase
MPAGLTPRSSTWAGRSWWCRSFTLYGDTRKGRRPSFTAAAPGPQAEPLYERVVAAIAARGVPVGTGRFGARMQVQLVNDGPVTILLDSAEA